MKIYPTGTCALEFDGTIKGEWDNQYTANGSNRTRYHNITLYKSKTCYVLTIEFVSLFGEHPYTIAHQFNTLEDLATYLQTFDPVEHTIVYCRYEEQERKDRELKNFKLDWKALITEVLHELDIVTKLEPIPYSSNQNLNLGSSLDLSRILELQSKILTKADVEGIEQTTITELNLSILIGLCCYLKSIAAEREITVPEVVKLLWTSKAFEIDDRS